MRGGGVKAEIRSLPSSVGSLAGVPAAPTAPPGHAAPRPRRPGASVPARSPGGGERGGPRASGHRLRSSGGAGRGFPPPNTHTLPARLPSLPAALLISSPKGAPSPPRPPVNPWGPGAPAGGGSWWRPRGLRSNISAPPGTPSAPAEEGNGRQDPQAPPYPDPGPPGCSGGVYGGQSGAGCVRGGHAAALGAVSCTARS